PGTRHRPGRPYQRRARPPHQGCGAARMTQSARAPQYEFRGMSLPEIRERPSPNHDSRGEAAGTLGGGPPRIDMLVLHYTGMQSAQAALDRLCDPEARVSSHYLV